jgi:hypothetical protein
MKNPSLQLKGCNELCIQIPHTNMILLGRAVAQMFCRRLATAVAGFEPVSSHVGSVIDRKSLGLVFVEYFGFPCHLFIPLIAP